MNKTTGIKLGITATFTAITASLGWFGWLIIVWIGCMVIDYISGSAAACKNGEWSSQKAREGIWHKTGEILAILVAGMLDYLIFTVTTNLHAITLPFDYSVLLCPIVVIWYMLTEMGSIIENIGALGAPVPDFLKKTIVIFKDKLDHKDEKDE